MAAIDVEIVYALADRQVVAGVALTPGMTLREAIERSGILGEFPGIDLARQRIGVFGQLRDLDEPARSGDRIEIYRVAPDPKELRRRRASPSS